MIVWPGLRRSVSAIQRLFNSASFYAPLTHSAVPVRAAPGTTATFTRATTATVRDNEGVLRTAIAGEARFEGARRVRNQFTFSQAFDNAAWSKFRSSVSANATTAPDGTLTADKLVEDGTAGNSHFIQQNTVGTAGNMEVVSIYAKPAGRDWVYLQLGNVHYAYFNVSTGVVGTVVGSGATTSIELDEEGFYRCSLSAVRVTSQINYVAIASADNTVSYNGDGTSGIYIWGAQLEDVTTQTTQTAGEYVSVGVPSDWAGPEFISNGTFDTDTTGWTAGEILGGAAGTLSTNSGRLRITNTGTSYGAAYQTFTTVVGTRYVLSGSAYLGSNTLWAVRLGSTGFPSFDYGNPSSGSDGSISISFIATTTSTTLTLYGLNNPDAYVEFDNISVKPAYYHGSMVDGVKCFATDLAGNALTTMLGYLAEGARTNLCLQSQTFGTTWGPDGSTSVAENQYVAPDGTISMDKITTIAVTSQHYLKQAITFSASATTYSCYLRYVNNRWAALVMSNGGGILAASFDLLNGVTGAVGVGTTSTIEATAIPDVYRCSITGTMSAGAGNVYISPNATDSASLQNYTAAGTETIGAWGAQLELGSFASSYIPTTTAAVTRDADVLTYSSAGNIDGTNGWCYAELSTQYTTASGYLDAVSSGGGTGVQILGIGAGAASTTAFTTDGSTLTTKSGLSDMATGARKRVSSWGGSTYGVTGDGLAPATNNFDGTMATTASIGIGCNAVGTGNWFGNIGPIYIGQRQLSASELGAITA